MSNLIETVSEAIISICTEEMVPRFRALDPSEIGSKDGGDVVTIVDTICEQRLSAALTGLLPGSVVVGEEGVAANSTVLDRLNGYDDAWLIDPLDGTKNFAEGSADFASMVALVRRQEVVGGWIYLPSTGIISAAERGAGVSIDGARRTFSADKSVSSLTGNYNLPAKGARRERLLPLREATDRQIPIGCAGSSYLNLIRGVVDFVLFHNLHPWDHAPGSLMIEEAGGVARLANGENYTVVHRRGPMIGASSEQLWQSLAGLMQIEEAPSTA
ncbi:MAG: inositol monophosphatase [Pseudomonadota bacterium]